MEEGDRLKRGRVAAVTQAAKRMVLDVQKERLVEEFVKDLIEEAAKSKREAEELGLEHEEEVRDIHGEWLKDYRRVKRELENLKLAQETKLVEQEVSTSLEDSLHENLQTGKRRIEALEAEIFQHAKAAEDLFLPTVEENPSPLSHFPGFPEDETTDVEFDALSELSTSSTCVSSAGGSTPRSTKPSHRTRRRCISQGGEPSKHSLLFSPNDNSNQTTFALRPLVIDQIDSVSRMGMKMAASTRVYNHSGHPSAERNRTTSALSQRFSSTPLKGYSLETKAGGLTSKQRAPWRI